MGDGMIQQWRERIRAAASQATPLRLVGGGTKPWLIPEQGDLLGTTDYSGIVDYEPSELVITARCGTPLTQIEALLEDCLVRAAPLPVPCVTLS
jgi:glycolate oxidase FAD binding subunit